jgi:hypothetical protein
MQLFTLSRHLSKLGKLAMVLANCYTTLGSC